MNKKLIIALIAFVAITAALDAPTAGKAEFCNTAVG